MITALDHVQLAAPASSEELLRGYYRDILGMVELPKPPVLAARGGVWFAAGADRSVHVHIGVEEPFTPARKAHPGLRVSGIREFAERIAARGAEVVWDGDLPGHLRFYSHDPVGNRLEFLEPTADR